MLTYEQALKDLESYSKKIWSLEAELAAANERSKANYERWLLDSEKLDAAHAALRQARAELEWIRRHSYEEINWRAEAIIDAINAVLKEKPQDNTTFHHPV